MKLATSITLLFTISFALVVNLAGAKETADSFAGNWILDKRSPRPGDAPNDMQTKIKQDGSGFTFESTFKEPENGVLPLLYLGLLTEKLRLSTNGQEQQSQIGPFMAVYKTSMDGNKLMTEWAAQINGAPVQGQWIHTLSEDGNHMTLEIKETSTNTQHAEATLYFVRK